ncbi:MAG: pentapeptide repeat-containing protein [Methanotrichaceae archaeon]
MGADLRQAALVETNLERATLTGCIIYGISAWEVKLGGAMQNDLVITPLSEPAITVDNLKSPSLFISFFTTRRSAT